MSKDAGLNNIRLVIQIRPLGMLAGQCRQRNKDYLITLSQDWDIPTLAHELKHVYFFERGLNKNSGGEESSCRLHENKYK